MAKKKKVDTINLLQNCRRGNYRELLVSLGEPVIQAWPTLLLFLVHQNDIPTVSVKILDLKENTHS